MNGLWFVMLTLRLPRSLSPRTALPPTDGMVCQYIIAQAYPRMGKALMMAGELEEADQAFRLGIFDVRLGVGESGMPSLNGVIARICCYANE